MAKTAAKKANFSLGGVALEEDLTSISQNVTQELPVVTALGDTGPRRVVGNYDFNYSLEGAADFASGQSDSTLFAGIGASTPTASSFDPTGQSAGPDDPNYDADDVLVENYNITAAVGQGITFTATLQGNSALTRATS